MNADLTLSHLSKHGIKPSMQRIAVMEYLLSHKTHPTADEIYSSLHPSMPTLSKTTVYNTLKVLTDKGAVNQLTIDERNVCFDAFTEPHAHFLCTRCGKVYDVALTDQDLAHHAFLPTGFRMEQTQLYFRGCCEKCAQKTEDQTL